MFSVISAWFVSRLSIKAEIEKLQKTWEHEDVVSSDDEFSQMAESVAIYLYGGISIANCIGKVSALRSKEYGELAKSLDDLYIAIQTLDKTAINKALSKVIKEKRKAKSHQQSQNDGT